MKDGGPAFPMSFGPYSEGDTGMSLRDYCAIKIYAALIQKAETISIVDDLGSRESQLALAFADTFIKSREEQS